MKNLTTLLLISMFAAALAYGQEAIDNSATITDQVETVDNPALMTDQKTCTVTIHLTGLDSNEGKLMVGLYSSEDTWLGKSYKGELVNIENKEATVVFTDVPYGVYAASAVHDEDSNGKMNSGAFGIPSEPYASSRGAKGMFGPPKWEDAKFTLSTSEVTEEIKF